MNKARLVKAAVLSGAAWLVVAVVLGVALSSAFGAEAEAPAAEAAPSGSTGWIALAMAISVASGALGAGYAVGKVGSAALGAASERPELIGRALVFVVIAEGIAVWGLVGAILLIGKL
jgi:V/A-type H+/Na+-transporting ATPase subunit K